jgi:hypothetical protein
MVLVMMFLSTSVFLWTLSQNTLYNEAIREKNQLESDVLSENVQVTNTTYVVNGNDQVQISVDITNPSSLGVQFTTLWVYASNATYTGYNFTKLSNVNVQGGANLPLSFNMTVGGLRLGGAYSFASWFITGRGNVVPLQKSTLSNIVIAQTTQGIGSLMMDFQNFTYYNLTETGPYYIYDNASASGYWVNSAQKNIAFRVILTNLDSKSRTISLSSSSVFFSIFPYSKNPAQTVACSFWYIVNVNETSRLISPNYAPVVLSPPDATGVYPTSVFFASKYPVTSSQGLTPWPAQFLGTCPVNLALVGTIGPDLFGQNIPFVSICINS